MDPSRAHMHFMLDCQRIEREVQGVKYKRIRTREAVVLSNTQENRYWSISIVGIGSVFMNLVHSIGVW